MQSDHSGHAPGRSAEILPSSDSSKNILLVDDDPDLCELVQTELARRGFVVSAYTSAAPALAALDSRDFAILLVDLQMAEMDGIAMCRAAFAKRPDLI